MPETIAEILAAYRTGTATPADIVARSYARIRAHRDPAIFITLRDEKDVGAEAQALTRSDRKSLPLYGIPIAAKDNIDVAGLPTTAACAAFGYRADTDATAVARLRAAGALIIGKTNLDQFATGLVGTRSPHGTPRNLFDARLIPGGSSSGSSVAVGAGIVPLALGTDTAGSGRVPAAFNNIVGLKPSLGLVSNAGVVPACRALDCVSIFAFTVDDAMTVLGLIAGPDDADPFSRARSLQTAVPSLQAFKLGAPLAEHREFFGDKISAAAYHVGCRDFPLRLWRGAVAEPFLLNIWPRVLFPSPTDVFGLSSPTCAPACCWRTSASAWRVSAGASWSGPPSPFLWAISWASTARAAISSSR